MPSFNPSHYYRYAELTELLKSFVSSNPQLAQLESIGKTTEKRDIWLLTLTNSKTGQHQEKPAFWIDANTHAGEVTGCQASLYFANRLLTGFGKDQEITSLLDHLTFYIVPRISADGAELYLTSPYALRASTVMWPYNEMIESHYPKDLDGNGKILMMRKADSAGTFKISKKNPKLMIQREHADWNSQNEIFYHLYTEGEFHQYDGFTKKFSPQYGFDLNRQFPAGFRPEGEQKGAGPYPQYLPEAQALVKAVTERPNITIAHTYHTYGGMVLRPPSGIPDEKLDAHDFYIYKKLSELAAQKMGYKVYSTSKDFKYAHDEVITGIFDDWLYLHRGIVGSTIEIWDVAAQAGMAYKNPTDCYFCPTENHLVAIYDWCEKNLPAGSFHADWVPFNHPQLGEVEIGGWDWKFVFQNPPASFLEKEISKVCDGSLSAAKACPVVKIRSIQKTKLSPGQWKLEVVLCNEGYLGTNGTTQAIKSGAARKPRVQLQLASNMKLLSGKAEFEIEHLAGRSNRQHWHSPVWYSEHPNNNECRLEWIVEGSGDLQLKVNLERGGILKSVIPFEA